MPRAEALKPEQVPAGSKPTLDAFTKNIGFTPNMMATFAQSPIAFNAWAALFGSLSKALDAKTRDSIGLGQFLVKDFVLLGAAVYTGRESLAHLAEQVILTRWSDEATPLGRMRMPGRSSTEQSRRG
jgi:hypothetical protein